MTPAVTPREHRRGILMMAAAAICWSTAGILTRESAISNGWETTFWRSFYASLFMAALLYTWHGRATVSRIRATGLPGLLSGLLLAVMITCFMLALSRTSTANTLMLTCTSPFYAAIMGRLFLREKVPLRTWIAMPCAFAGIFLMFFQSLDAGGGKGLSGNLIALLVPLAYGFNIVVIRKGGHVADMAPTVLLGAVFSALLALPFALPFTATRFDHLLMLVLGVVQLGVGCVLMIRAVRYLRATEVGLLSLLETILGPIWTWIGVGETPAAMTLVGGAIVVSALVANELAGLWLENPVKVAKTG